MPNSERGSNPDSRFRSSANATGIAAPSALFQSYRRQPTPSRLSAPLAQKHVPVESRLPSSADLPEDCSKRPILARTPSSAPLVPRDERTQAAWKSPTSPRGFPLAGLGLRDSIATDPFFRQYYGSRMDEVVQSIKAHSRDKSRPWWSWMKRDKELGDVREGKDETIEMEGPPIHDFKYESSTMVELTLRITGAPSACESSISEAIQLGGDKPLRTAEVLVDGKTILLHLIELPEPSDRCDSGENTQRESLLEDKVGPEVDGAITIYNEDDPKGRQAVLPILKSVHEAAIPNLVVTVQNDPAATPRLDQRKALKEQARLVSDGAEIFRTKISSPERAKRCVFLLIQHILYERSKTGFWSRPTSRARSSSSEDQFARLAKSQPHSRATSEIVPPIVKPSASCGDIMNTMNPLSRSKSADFPCLESCDNSIMGEIGGTFFATPSSADSQSVVTDCSVTAAASRVPSSRSSNGRPSGRKSNSRSSSASNVSRRPPLPNLDDHRPDQKTFSFQDLTEKLVAQSDSKIDADKFVAMFLALYRFFAAPVELLDALTVQFEESNKDNAPKQPTTVEQRVLSVLCTWIHTYPGDFVQRPTRTRVTRFISKIEHGSWHVAATEKLRFGLGHAVEDDDTYWPRSDQDADGTRMSVGSTKSDCTEDCGLQLMSSFGSGVSSSGTTDQSDTELIFRNTTLRTLAAMGPSSSGVSTSKPSQPPPDAIGSAQRQAAQLNPDPSCHFSKVHWHQFVEEFSEDAIAREMTRIDWIMFSSIHPRDLVRHVTLRSEDQEHYEGLANVDRMIEHFNRLVDWVTYVILFRDKPKHRALALEKFMRLARRLRDLNNYNALGAVVAAIQGSSIHRLAATRMLVSEEVEKNFMRLEILLSTQKGHLPYRLAWDNTSGPRVPFFFLHRRDLVIAAVANKTFLSNPSPPPPHPTESAAKANGTPPTSRASNHSRDRILPAHSGVAMGSFLSIEDDSTPEISKAPTPREASSNVRHNPDHPPPDPHHHCQQKINWTKFEIMGEILLGLQRAQAQPYPAAALNPPNKDVRALLLRSAISRNEDEMYERSVALEPGPGPTAFAAAVAAAAGDAAAAVKSSGRSGGISGSGVVAGIKGTGVRRKMTWLAKQRGGER